jgi:competence protein ComFC
MLDPFKKLGSDLLSVLFPDICCGCGNVLFKKEKHICLHCYYKLPRTKFEINSNNPVEKIFKGRIPIEGASSFLYFKQKGISQKLIHQFKYKKNVELGQYLSELYAKDILENNPTYKPDLIACVPLHPRKKNQRGFNQSEIIAFKISSELNIPFDKTLLIRTQYSQTQTRKQRFERWENTEQIFKLNPKIDIKNKHIAIVDDVITTGSTIESCARLLQENHHCKISFLSLCLTSK